jgi:hypothetical protein
MTKKIILGPFFRRVSPFKTTLLVLAAEPGRTEELLAFNSLAAFFLVAHEGFVRGAGEVISGVAADGRDEGVTAATDGGSLIQGKKEGLSEFFNWS